MARRCWAAAGASECVFLDLGCHFVSTGPEGGVMTRRYKAGVRARTSAYTFLQVMFVVPTRS